MSRADRHSGVDQNCVELVLVWHLLIRAISIYFQLFRVLDVVTEFGAHHGETLQTNGKNIRCTMHCKLLLRIGHLTALFTLVFVTFVKPLFSSKLLKALVQIFASLKLHQFLSVFSSVTSISRDISRKDSYVSELCRQAMQVTLDRNQPPKIRCGIVVVPSYLSNLP